MPCGLAVFAYGRQSSHRVAVFGLWAFRQSVTTPCASWCGILRHCADRGGNLTRRTSRARAITLREDLRKVSTPCARQSRTATKTLNPRRRNVGVPRRPNTRNAKPTAAGNEPKTFRPSKHLCTLHLATAPVSCSITRPFAPRPTRCAVCPPPLARCYVCHRRRPYIRKCGRRSMSATSAARNICISVSLGRSLLAGGGFRFLPCLRACSPSGAQSPSLSFAPAARRMSVCANARPLCSASPPRRLPHPARSLPLRARCARPRLASCPDVRASLRSPARNPAAV